MVSHNFNDIDRHRTCGRQRSRFARTNIEFGPVPRALHRAIEYLSGGQRRLRVAATISDRVHIIAESKQGDSMPGDIYSTAGGLSELIQSGDTVTPSHGAIRSYLAIAAARSIGLSCW